MSDLLGYSHRVGPLDRKLVDAVPLGRSEPDGIALAGLTARDIVPNEDSVGPVEAGLRVSLMLNIAQNPIPRSVGPPAISKFGK